MEDSRDIYEKTLGQMRIDVAVILNKVNYIEGEMKALKTTLSDLDSKYVLRGEHASMEELEDKFVTHMEFEPIKKSVFTFIGIIVVGVISAILSLTLQHK